jgi:hypothetical protein
MKSKNTHFIIFHATLHFIYSFEAHEKLKRIFTTPYKFLSFGKMQYISHLGTADIEANFSRPLSAFD